MSEDEPSEIERHKNAARIAIINLGEVGAQRDALAKTLAGCLDLITSLMGDLRAAGVAPSVVSVVAKAKFDAEIRQILARYGQNLPAEKEASR
jgi:hypothetical protein